MRKNLKTFYLEMNRPSQLRPFRLEQDALTFQKIEAPNPDFCRFLYATVGEAWWWVDRLNWDFSQWQRHLNRPDIETWVGYLSGAPYGYCELEKENPDSIFIAYFGLLPSCFGKGLGKHLLTETMLRAWALDPVRVWVHTCTLDHPHALNNYLKRGFTHYKTEEGYRDLPDDPPRIWPNRHPCGGDQSAVTTEAPALGTKGGIDG